MKTKNYLFLLFLFAFSLINAQENEYSQIEASSQNNGIEIGVNATRLLRNIFADNNGSSSPFSILFNAPLSSNSKLRTGFSFSHNVIDNIAEMRKSVFDSYGGSIGIQKDLTPEKDVLVYFGFDITGSYAKSNTISTFDFGGGQETFESSSSTYSIGGGPILGLGYNLNSSLSIRTESSLFYVFGKTTNRFDQFGFPMQEETEVSKLRNFRLNAPTSLLLYFTF